jgi:hypothetical protein
MTSASIGKAGRVGTARLDAGRMPAPPPVPERRPFLGPILREPLLQFLLAGGLLVLAARTHGGAVDRRPIVVDPARAAQIDAEASARAAAYARALAEPERRYPVARQDRGAGS